MLLWPILKRVLRMLGVLWAASFGAFLLTNFIPGDPIAAVYGETATPEQMAHARAQLGLDLPVWERYLSWLAGVVRFDFGETLVPPVLAVSTIMTGALGVTLQLAVMAMLITLVISVPLGALAAYYEGSALDKLIAGTSFGLLSLPPFVLGLFLILLMVFNVEAVQMVALVLGLAATAYLLFSRRRSRSRGPKQWLWAAVPALLGVLAYFFLPAMPRQGWISPGDDLIGSLRHAFLPALTMSLSVIPLWSQLLRADMIVTLRQDFITVARARGATPVQIVIREALRPSLFSLVTVAAISFGTLIAGSVIVETIFGLPGLGRTLVVAVTESDYPVVQAGILIAASAFVILNTLVDVTYSLLDPRIRRGAH